MRAVAVAVVLSAANAAAQPMMDPTQMSGVSRPDPQVPEGVLTVKVVRGAVGQYAPVGTKVHLVGVSADGKVTDTVQAVTGDGRAEFTGLDREGMTAYYAMTLFEDDRLMSQQAVVLPPKVGVGSAGS